MLVTWGPSRFGFVCVDSGCPVCVGFVGTPCPLSNLLVLYLLRTVLYTPPRAARLGGAREEGTQCKMSRGAHW